eukprot:gene13071-biopygen468
MLVSAIVNNKDQHFWTKSHRCLARLESVARRTPFHLPHPAPSDLFPQAGTRDRRTCARPGPSILIPSMARRPCVETGQVERGSTGPTLPGRLEVKTGTTVPAGDVEPCSSAETGYDGPQLKGGSTVQRQKTGTTVPGDVEPCLKIGTTDWYHGPRLGENRCDGPGNAGFYNRARRTLGETARDASGTPPFLQNLSCGTRPGRRGGRREGSRLPHKYHLRRTQKAAQQPQEPVGGEGGPGWGGDGDECFHRRGVSTLELPGGGPPEAKPLRRLLALPGYKLRSGWFEAAPGSPKENAAGATWSEARGTHSRGKYPQRLNHTNACIQSFSDRNPHRCRGMRFAGRDEESTTGKPAPFFMNHESYWVLRRMPWGLLARLRTSLGSPPPDTIGPHWEAPDRDCTACCVGCLSQLDIRKSPRVLRRAFLMAGEATPHPNAEEGSGIGEATGSVAAAAPSARLRGLVRTRPAAAAALSAGPARPTRAAQPQQHPLPAVLGLSRVAWPQQYTLPSLLGPARAR